MGLFQETLLKIRIKGAPQFKSIILPYNRNKISIGS